MNKNITLKIFENFVIPYNLTNEMIELKFLHTKRVADYCEQIAKSVKLTQEEIDLAWHIGIFHDLSRFEQITLYETFNDAKSFDHALHATKLLFDDNFISKFDIDEKYYDIICKAVKYHNKYNIPDNLTEKEKLFCRIIRDADMIDIMTSVKKLDWYDKEMKNQQITPIVLENFLSGKSIKHNIKQTILDQYIGTLGFINEIYFLESKRILISSGVLDKLTNIDATLPETKIQLYQIKEYIDKYKKSV